MLLGSFWAVKGSILLDHYVKERIRLVMLLKCCIVVDGEENGNMRNLIHHIIFFIHKIRSNLKNQ